MNDLKIIVPRFIKSNGFSTSIKHSNTMKRIRGNNTKCEIVFRKALWKNGVRYRLKNQKIPGKPDLIIKRYRLLIFVDGDFWHGYNWMEKKSKIKSNSNYWIPKIERNIQRDLEINKILKDKNWTVLRFWEHQIQKDMEQCINLVIETIESLIVNS